MQAYPRMSQERRKLYLSIWAGYEDTHSITTRFHYLDAHFPDEKLNAALNWLLRNQLTGKRFVEFVRAECFNSNLELHRKLLEKINVEKGVRILYGKDFRG
jgi:hypothetical protein